jgi:carbon storage regulator
MLVLSRHADEAIIVDGHIRIVVVSIRGDKVRLGIEAPAEIHILREELLANGSGRGAEKRPETGDSL